MHLYNVVTAGADPLIAKITRVVPVASLDHETLDVKREATNPPVTSDAPLLANNPSPLTPDHSRGSE